MGKQRVHKLRLVSLGEKLGALETVVQTPEGSSIALEKNYPAGLSVESAVCP